MNILSKFYLILFLLTISVTSKCFSQIDLSLQQAIETALKNNLQIKQSVVNEAIAQQGVRQAKANILPSLNANMNESLNFGRSLDYTTYNYVTQKTNLANETLTANITLFQGFQKVRQISANKLIVEADKSATQKVKNDLILNVVLSYLTILSAKDGLLAANQQLQLAQEQLDIAIKNFKVGKKMSADISVARSQVAKAELNITTIQNQMNNSVLDLIQFMNLPPNSKINLIEPQNDDNKFQEKSTFEIYNTALQSLPDIKQAILNKQYEEAQLKIMKGGYYPTIALSGGTSSNYSHIVGLNNPFFGPQATFLTQFKTNLTQYVGLSVNIPIFNNLNTKISLAKEKLNLETALISEETVKNNIYKVINQANEDLHAALKTYSYSKEAYNSAIETYNITKKRYEVGLSNSIELNQAQNQMNQAQFDCIHSKYDFIFKSKVIDFYLGKPLTY